MPDHEGPIFHPAVGGWGGTPPAHGRPGGAAAPPPVALACYEGLDSGLYLIYLAIRQHGTPEALVTDSGSVFRAHQAQRVYAALGIQKHEIARGQPW